MSKKPYAIFELELEDDEDEGGQLGASELVDTGALLRTVGATVAWRSAFSKTFRVIVECQTPTRIVWDGVEACLVTLKVEFRAEKGSRFHEAFLEVSFVDEDAATSDLNGPQPAAAVANRPSVLAFAPGVFHGIETEEPRDREVGGNIGVGDPTGIANAGLNYKDHRSRNVAFHQVVHGSREQTRANSMVRWTVRENESCKSGLYESFSVLAVVAHRPGRRFAARVQGWFKTFVPFMRPVFGKKDEHIFFDPATLALSGEAFDVAKLRELTRLAAYGGRFVQ